MRDEEETAGSEGTALTLGRRLSSGGGRGVEGRVGGTEKRKDQSTDFAEQVRSEVGSGPVLRPRLETSEGGKTLDGAMSWGEGEGGSETAVSRGVRFSLPA